MVIHTKYSYLEMFTVITTRLFSVKYVQLLSTSLEGSGPIVGEAVFIFGRGTCPKSILIVSWTQPRKLLDPHGGLLPFFIEGS